MDLLVYGLIVGMMLICIGFGLLWGYLMCLRNHKLIKGEENMWNKKFASENKGVKNGN